MKYKYFLNLLLSSILLFSCAENDKKTVQKLVQLDYNFQNHIENISSENQPIKIKERNFLHIEVDSVGNCKIDGKKVKKSNLVEEIKKVIVGDSNNPNMPTTIIMNFDYAGEVAVQDKLIINGTFDSKLKYDDYKEIRDKIFLTYSEVRNEFSLKKYGKNINEIISSFLENGENPEDFNRAPEIFQIYPIRYYETKKEKVN